MTVRDLHHVSVVVDDLESATAFFAALGLEVEGEAPVDGEAVDRLNAIDGVRIRIVMMRTPDGHGRLELTRFDHPPAVGSEDPATPNRRGLRSVMFGVDDLDATLAGLGPHGAELVGEVVQYEQAYRLAYVRGPAGIIVSLAEALG